MAARGFDTTGNCAPHIAAIKAAGYSFVARYSSHSAWKNMTKTEVQALSRARIHVVNVWETRGDHVGFFTHAQGLLDGAAAFAFAQHIGQPISSPIYFAVDTDVSAADRSAYVLPYFQGVRESFQRHGAIGVHAYKVGVYGSGAVCDQLKQAGYVSYAWLAQSAGWEGFHSFSGWNLKQLAAISFNGLSVDEDVSSGNGGGFLVSA